MIQVLLVLHATSSCEISLPLLKNYGDNLNLIPCFLLLLPSAATMIFKTSLLFLAMMAASSLASTQNQQIYVVHMDNTKINSLGNSERWYESIMDSLEEEEDEKESSSPQILYVYESAISGFAAKLSSKHLESLAKIDGFLSAMPDEMLSLHTTHSAEFLGLRREKGLWNTSNMASEVIIGVVDTGIWPEHVSFRDTGMSPVPSWWKGMCEAGTRFSKSTCNRKLIGARAFFRGYEAVVGRINETEEFRSARDSEGHGTHTASTAAGNLIDGVNFYGMAKGSAGGMRYTARVAAYKVCWQLGCSNSDILAAVDQAITDGVDILSVSLGGVTREYHSDGLAIATFSATKKGVFVSCSAGNSGPSPYSVGNTAPWITTVAASYLDRRFPTTVSLGNGKIYTGASLYSGRPTGQLPLVYGETAAAGHSAEFCIDHSLSPKLVKGKIVVCERGINTWAEKGEQVKMAGGAGMILLNNDSEGEELFADPHILPATSLGASATNAIKSYINSTKKPTASIVFGGTVYGNPAPLMAAFSSRGPSLIGPDLIKPDVTAPGVNILAAWPPNMSPTRLATDKRRVQFNMISGTSMSCPHVSGVAALIKSVHRDWSPAAIKSALMTTAYTLDNKKGLIPDVGGSGHSESATPFAYGSGHIDPEKAADPGLIYDIATDDYLTYLCSLNYSSSEIALLSGGHFACPREANFQPGDLNYPSFAVILDANAKRTALTYKRTVTNVGPAASTYSVQVGEPNGVSVTVEPKVLKFKKAGEKLSYRVSFVGSKRPATSEFGSLVWVSRKYTVRSPIAVTWVELER